jgi:hypothetical protein
MSGSPVQSVLGRSVQFKEAAGSGDGEAAATRPLRIAAANGSFMPMTTDA